MIRMVSRYFICKRNCETCYRNIYFTTRFSIRWL